MRYTFEKKKKENNHGKSGLALYSQMSTATSITGPPSFFHLLVSASLPFFLEATYTLTPNQRCGSKISQLHYSKSLLHFTTHTFITTHAQKKKKKPTDTNSPSKTNVGFTSVCSPPTTLNKLNKQLSVDNRCWVRARCPSSPIPTPTKERNTQVAAAIISTSTMGFRAVVHKSKEMAGSAGGKKSKIFSNRHDP
jgi:hypothetical protein